VKRVKQKKKKKKKKREEKGFCVREYKLIFENRIQRVKKTKNEIAVMEIKEKPGENGGGRR